MITSEPDRAAVRFPPPLVFVLTIAAGLLLQKWALFLPIGLPQGVRRFAIWASLFFGAGFIVSAVALFRRTGQKPEPWESTPELIFKGPYAVTRNPMYLGMALLHGSAGLWHSNGWIIGLLPGGLIGVYLTAIRHEEAYLTYKAEVRRWL